jgi:peroxiredoxin
MHRVVRRSLLLLPLLCLSGTVDVAYAQQQAISFDERPSLKIVAPAFADADITRLTATLDALLASKESATKTLTLWNFARQLQAGRLTPAQEKTVLAHLDTVAKSHPAESEAVSRARYMVSKLTIGKVAPEIVGVDLSGAPLRLSDHRGKVVVLIFGAEWCGICRTMYPYERLMLELYKNWPLEVLGVETGSSARALQDLRAREGLTYRAWWDAPSETDHGAIAAEWNAAGVPTVYLIDENGVIRFVDLRYEDLLKGVRQLLAEHTEPLSRTASSAGPGLPPGASPGNAPVP